MCFFVCRGPPPGWFGPPPSKGSEIFVGKLPRDVFEEELVPVEIVYNLKPNSNLLNSVSSYF